MSIHLFQRRIELATFNKGYWCLRKFAATRRPYSNFQNSNEIVSQVPADTASSPVQKTITVSVPENVSSISGVPQEHINERLVRIYQTSKNAMQSGTNNVGHWELDFETRSRWENPLMGWTSTGDPLSNMKIQFIDKESAIKFAEKNGYKWFIEAETKEMPRVKSYGFNFSWNKRTRVSTK